VRADDGKQCAKFARKQFDAGYSEAITQTMQRIESLPAVVIADIVGITKATVIAAIKEL
jgi:GTP-sensing pleiotropic transcriptional regulator CodY